LKKLGNASIKKYFALNVVLMWRAVGCAQDMKTKTRNAIFGALGAAAWLLSGAVTLQAQDGPPPGNADPEQRRQRMMERMREQFGVTDDAEWKAISERIAKVMEARRSIGGGFGGGFMRPPGGPGRPGPADGSPPRPGNDGNVQVNPDNAGGPPPPGGPDTRGGFGGPGGPGGPGPGFGGPRSPEMEALRKAIESKASVDELKARIAEVKAASQKNRAALEKAQQDLKEVLSVPQEAVAMTMGLVN
jgi:hypothetical protein